MRMRWCNRFRLCLGLAVLQLLLPLGFREFNAEKMFLKKIEKNVKI